MFNTGLTDSIERHNKRATDSANLARLNLRYMREIPAIQNRIRISLAQ